MTSKLSDSCMSQLDTAFVDSLEEGDWLSPSESNPLLGSMSLYNFSHFVVIEDDIAFTACLSATDSSNYDLSEADFDKFPACPDCKKAVAKLEAKTS